LLDFSSCIKHRTLKKKEEQKNSNQSILQHSTAITDKQRGNQFPSLKSCKKSKCISTFIIPRLKEMAAVRVKVSVTGIVQGVGFRPFIYRTAVHRGLKGYVKNKGDAGVEILVEGNHQAIKAFIQDLKAKRPPIAQIYGVTVLKLPGEPEYREFIINRSSDEAKSWGSTIPFDVAICNDCLRELKDPKDPRYNYFFITCTNCGPRFTTIKKLPYDRENTTMREFPMCNFCRSEYLNPLNRRFHAQTIACPRCGPKPYLTTGEGKLVKNDDPIRLAGRLLSEGRVIAIKGYGGFHLAASALKDEPLVRLRRAKHRNQKPFAIMARSLEATSTFADTSKEERNLLSSHNRPIVLLNKGKAYALSDLIAPGLHNVGVMLSYTAMHYMLFDEVRDPAFIMTSANPPNQPIIKDDDEALKDLRDTADYFLFHNRRIAYRCDDSVIRLHGKRTVFVRRSRGFAPAPLRIGMKTKSCALGLGGELNNAICILHENRAFISQHIGDVENVETKTFLEEATKHLIHLTNAKVAIIACDLHPKFITTQLAHKLAQENGWQVIQVQHHHAHVAALMAEHDIDEVVGICCDGYGYGADGQAWGGEILLCRREPVSFKRVGHLEEQPLLGDDLATRYPLRMAAGILNKKMDIQPWLTEHRRFFPHGEDEIRTMLSQLRSHRSMTQTTSCGRVLDAASAILGLCYERTYEGEPAMKLESIARKGKDFPRLGPIRIGDKLQTTQILWKLFEEKDRFSKANLALSVHSYLAEGLAELAIEKASENGIKSIGLSGGVACNEILTSRVRRAVEAAGLGFLVHETIPPGDGGISFGQAVVGGFLRP
jgi:hydrogenase maturation protein HypF